MALLAYSSDEVTGSALPHDDASPHESGLIAHSSDEVTGGQYLPSNASTASGYVAAGGGTTYDDWKQSVNVGMHGAGAATSSLFSATAPTGAQADYWQKQAELERQRQEQDVQRMTPAGQQGREGSFWSHPAQQLIEAGPSLAVQAAPAIVGGALAGPPGALAGAAIGGGLWNAGSASSDLAKQIMAAPEDTLMGNQDYADKIYGGMSPQDARLQLAREHGGPLAAKSAAIGAATALPFAEVGGSTVAKKVLGDKLVMRVLGGGLEGGVAMGGQGGAQTQISGQAGADVGIRGAPTPEETTEGIYEGLKTGFQIGSFGAAVHPSGTQTGGEMTVKRTQTKGYIKPEAQKDYTGAPPKPPAAPPSPTELIVSPDAKAALDANAGKPVTLGVGEQPGVAQTQTVQPIGETAQDQQGAPPAGKAPSGPPPPPPADEASAAPAPAPTVGPPVPESEATLRDQQAAMMDPANAREAMIYPPGVKPFDITANKWRYGTTKLPAPDGRWVQYDTRGPRALSKAKIADFAKKDAAGNDKINELLQLGPVPQVEAVKQSVAGVGDPAVVTERAPPIVPGEPGLERKAVEGTTATAPAQVEALEATKTPDSTVQVETHQQAMGDRFKKAREEAVARQQVEAAPMGAAEPTPGVAEPVKLGETKYLSVWDKGDGTYFKRYADGRPDEPITKTVADLLTKQEAYKPQVSEAETIRAAAQASAPPPVRRILRSETEEERQAAARQAEAQEKAAASTGPAPKPVKEAADVKEKRLGDEKKQKLLDINQVAREVANAPEHLPKADETLAAATEGKEVPGARKRILERATAMVKAARDKDYAFMRPLRDRVGETNHPNEGVLLHEAELLARKKVPKTSDIRRFMYAENELRNNGEAGRKAVMDMRSQTGRDWAAAGAAPTVETAHEGVEGGEARGIEPVEKPDVAEEMEKAKERVAEEAVAKAPGEERKETPLQKQAREASERARAKLEEREKAAPRERPTQESKPESASEDKHWKDMLSEAHKDKAEGDVTIGEAGRYVSLEHAVNVAKAAIEDGTIKPWQAHLINTLGIWPKDVGRVLAEIKGAETEAPRAAVGFKVEGRGRTKPDEVRAKLNEAKKEEPPHLADMVVERPQEKVKTQTMDGKPIEVTPLRSTTAEEVILKHLDLSKYSKEMRPMISRLVDAVIRIAGDTPVHYISHDAILNEIGRNSRGLYDNVHDQIFLNAEKLNPDTPLHEVFHAATSKAIMENPELNELINRLRKEMADNLPEIKDSVLQGTVVNAFKNTKEFLTYMMTNPSVQNIFKGIKISDQLAKDIGIPRWRKATLWNGLVDVIRQALKMEPRDTSAIEAAMAITDNLFMAKDPRFAIEAATRLAKQDMHDFDAIHEEVDSAAKGAQEAVHQPYEFWKSDFAKARASGTMQKVYSAWSKAAGSDTMRIASEHLFGRRDENNPMRRWQEGLAKQEQLIRKVLGDRSPLIQRVADMKRNDAEGLHEVVNLLLESRDFNVHPDDPLGAGRNDYIKSKKFDETAGVDRHEAILAHPRLSDSFEKMSPTQQALFRDLRDQLQDEGHKSAEATYQTFVVGLKENFAKDNKLQAALAKSENDRSPTEIKQVERYNAVSKVLDGDKLEGEEKEKFASDPHIQSLQGYRAMQSHEGPFYPTPRKGDWVVNATHELPEAPNALSMEGNEVTFATRKEAYEYRRQLVDKSLPSSMQAVHEPVSSEQMHGQGKETYKVTVQNKHSSAAENVHEGNKLAAALKAQGLKDVSPPMLREKNPNIDYGLHSGSIRAINHAIDALTHLSSEQKAGMKEALEQGTLGLMRGSKADLGLMNRNRVRGANADPVLAVHDYFAASARNRARAKTLPDIDKAMGEMRDTARTAGDDDTWKRGLLISEMENRTLNYGKEGFTGQMPPHLQHLSTLAYLKYMMAPIHYALDMMHPYLITIPQLAGRFGFAKAHLEFERAMGDIGGRTPALAKGLAGAWKAAWETGKPPTDFIEGMMNALKKNGATAQEISAIQRAMETGALHSILMDFRPHMDRTGKFDTMMQRAQSVGQEMSSAVDAINRMASFLAAYRLERGKMGKAETMAESAAHHAQATRFAKDHTTQTLGLYSASNRSSMLKNPYVRSAMQFRSVPMMIYKILGRNIYDTFKGESKEVRWAAVRSLVATMGSTALLVGGPAGIPEPIRLAVMLTHMFGLTGSWEQLEDEARRASDAALGPVGGRLVMDGVLGAAGLSAGSRIGLNDLLASQQSMQSPKDFLFETMVGASGGYLNDEMGSVGKLLAGDFQRGIPALIPIRLFSDVAKAWMEGEEGKPQTGRAPGMTPLDPFEMLIKAMGGQPTREALHGKMQGLIKQESADRAATQKSGDMTKIQSWNASHPHNRISVSQALRAKQANRPESATTRQLREDYRAYQ